MFTEKEVQHIHNKIAISTEAYEDLQHLCHIFERAKEELQKHDITLSRVEYEHGPVTGEIWDRNGLTILNLWVGDETIVSNFTAHTPLTMLANIMPYRNIIIGFAMALKAEFTEVVVNSNFLL